MSPLAAFLFGIAFVGFIIFGIALLYSVWRLNKSVGILATIIEPLAKEVRVVDLAKSVLALSAIAPALITHVEKLVQSVNTLQVTVFSNEGRAVQEPPYTPTAAISPEAVQRGIAAARAGRAPSVEIPATDTNSAWVPYNEQEAAVAEEQEVQRRNGVELNESRAGNPEQNPGIVSEV